MAIVQITSETGSTTFEEWVTGLTGEALTEAQAAISDRETKFNVALEAGNVYHNASSNCVWISEEAEQAFVDSVTPAYAGLWDQWKEETGGSLQTEFTAADASSLKLDHAVWIKTNLSTDDYATFLTQQENMLANVQAAVDAGHATYDAATQKITFTDADAGDAFRSANSVFVSAKDGYQAYLAS
tara:strand:- start:252 stop:806 length:555 start_codon:yes stop_codon:yes gene_type:complete